MAPPTIAPRFIGSCLEAIGIGSDVEDTNEELITELEIDGGTEDVATTVAVGCETTPIKALLGREVELDDASAVFGTGRSLSVRASAPQAMYSKD